MATQMQPLRDRQREAEPFPCQAIGGRMTPPINFHSSYLCIYDVGLPSANVLVNRMRCYRLCEDANASVDRNRLARDVASRWI